jgi:PIN domain nuclease of toxin-antitoxin system
VILLDTCTLLWLVSGHERLSVRARERIEGSRGAIFVSAISALEVALEQRKGRLELPLSPHEWYPLALRHHGVVEIPITGSIALDSAALPDLHRDPADRVIVATAHAHQLTILSPDPLIRAYPEVRTDW